MRNTYPLSPDVLQGKRALQVKRAAEVLDVSISTIWRWQRKGVINIVTIGGERGTALVPVTEIDRLLSGEGAERAA